jgi:hypothetical protein
MDTVGTTVETPTRPTPTATDAAHALQQLLEHLVPTADRPAFRARLHEAAQALQRALDAGASMDAVLDQLIGLTVPPAPLPPYEPWRSLLSMTFAEFAESGVGLHVRLPALGEGIWLVSDAATQAAVVRETRLWDRYVKRLPWMIEEADRLRLPTAERTVGSA